MRRVSWEKTKAERLKYKRDTKAQKLYTTIITTKPKANATIGKKKKKIQDIKSQI